MKTSEILQAALALLGPNGERWRKVFITDGCDCCLTAIHKSSRGDSVGVMSAISVMEEVIGGHIALWNDQWCRTWTHIKKAFKLAIARAQAMEAKQ